MNSRSEFTWVKLDERQGVSLWRRLDAKNRYGLSYDGKPPKGQGHRRETVLDRYPKQEAKCSK